MLIAVYSALCSIATTNEEPCEDCEQKGRCDARESQEVTTNEEQCEDCERDMLYLAALLIFAGGVGVGWKIRQTAYEEVIHVQHHEIMHLTEQLASTPFRNPPV